jgi:large subunit ribosomal protein L9
MKVILTQNVQNLGLKGDIIEVALGYTRNYLLPKGLVELVTQETLKKAQAIKTTRTKQEEEEKKKAQNLAKKLEKITITIPAKVGEKGKLFGSITSEEIAKNLKNQTKIEVNKKAILLEEPIKKVGKHDVKVKLFKDVEVVLKVKIEEKK